MKERKRGSGGAKRRNKPENKITRTKNLIEDERANGKVGGNLSFVASDFGSFSFIAQMRLPLHVCAFT